MGNLILLKGPIILVLSSISPLFPAQDREAHPEYYGENTWPRADDKGIEGFESAFKELGRYDCMP